MTALGALELAEKMLKLNDPYEIARLLLELEGAAKKEAVSEFADSLRSVLQ